MDETVAFCMPMDIELDEPGNLYVLDTGNHRIQKFSPQGKFLSTIGRRGQVRVSLSTPFLWLWIRMASRRRTPIPGEDFPQKPAFVLKKDTQHLRHGEDHLAVGNIQEKLLPHPLTPFLPPLRMARWAKSASATGKVKEALISTVRTPDVGKPAERVAAVEVALDHILDDGSEEAVLSLFGCRFSSSLSISP
jgi:hypothetical protein